MVGIIKAIDGTISALKNDELVLMVMEGWQDYLSCEIKLSKDKKRTWWGQLHLIKKMRRILESVSKMFRVIKLQVLINFLLLSLLCTVKRFLQKISENIVGVGMLLCLVKHVCPIFSWPGNYWKQIIVQTLWLKKNFYVWSSIFRHKEPWFNDQTLGHSML